jgi:hypothetical protein
LENHGYFKSSYRFSSHISSCSPTRPGWCRKLTEEKWLRKEDRLWECVCSTVQAFEEAEAVSQSVRDLLLQVQLCASGYVRKLRQVPVLR